MQLTTWKKVLKVKQCPWREEKKYWYRSRNRKLVICCDHQKTNFDRLQSSIATELFYASLSWILYRRSDRTVTKFFQATGELPTCTRGWLLLARCFHSQNFRQHTFLSLLNSGWSSRCLIPFSFTDGSCFVLSASSFSFITAFSFDLNDPMVLSYGNLKTKCTCRRYQNTHGARQQALPRFFFLFFDTVPDVPEVVFFFHISTQFWTSTHFTCELFQFRYFRVLWFNFHRTPPVDRNPQHSQTSQTPPRRSQKPTTRKMCQGIKLFCLEPSLFTTSGN